MMLPIMISETTMIIITNPPNDVGDYDHSRHKPLRGLHHNASTIFVIIQFVTITALLQPNAYFIGIYGSDAEFSGVW